MVRNCPFVSKLNLEIVKASVILIWWLCRANCSCRTDLIIKTKLLKDVNQTDEMEESKRALGEQKNMGMEIEEGPKITRKPKMRSCGITLLYEIPQSLKRLVINCGVWRFCIISEEIMVKSPKVEWFGCICLGFHWEEEPDTMMLAPVCLFCFLQEKWDLRTRMWLSHTILESGKSPRRV